MENVIIYSLLIISCLLLTQLYKKNQEIKQLREGKQRLLNKNQYFRYMIQFVKEENNSLIEKIYSQEKRKEAKFLSLVKSIAEDLHNNREFVDNNVIQLCDYQKK